MSLRSEGGGFSWIVYRSFVFIFFIVKMQKAIQKRCKNKRDEKIVFGLFYSFRTNILLSLIKRKFNIKQFEVLLNFFDRKDLKRLITLREAMGSLKKIQSIWSNSLI